MTIEAVKPRPVGASRHRARVFATVALLGAATLAWTHTKLIGSIPGADATIDASPRVVLLTFSEDAEPRLTTVRIARAGGDTIALTGVRATNQPAHSIVADVPAALADGSYVVIWETAGDDGHPVRGAFGFTIAAHNGAPAPPARVDTAATTNADERTQSPFAVAIRWVAFAALLLIVGVAAYGNLVVRRLRRSSVASADALRGAEASAARVGVLAATLWIAMGICRFAAELDAFPGAHAADVAFRTTWGRAWSAGLVLAAASAVVLMVLRAKYRAGAPAARAWSTAGVLVALLAFTPALGGHAVAGPLAPLAVAADGFHIIGAGVWLGSLAVVILAGVPAAFAQRGRDGEAVVADLVNAFSPTALTGASILVTTGLFAACVQVGSVAALTHTSYGEMLILKLVFVGMTAAVGALNWRRIRRRLGAPGKADLLRRSVKFELMFAAGVLLVTAVLVGLAPGRM